MANEVYVIYPDAAGDVDPPIGARLTLDEAKLLVDETVSRDYSWASLTRSDYSISQDKDFETYEVTYKDKGDSHLSITYYVRKLPL